MVDINILTGVHPTTQRPLDAKTYFQTLAEMADLGTSQYKAFYYYDRMRALCLEDDKIYVWREETSPGESGGVVGTSYTYPANTINNGIDYSGKTFNFFPLDASDESLPLTEDYGAIFIGSNQWDCWGRPYIINNVAYTAPDTILTLPGPPVTPGYIRFDVIYGDTSNTINFIQGTEGISASIPDIDENTQKLFQIVAWAEGQADPVGIASIQVYNENAGEPNEWTASTSEPTVDLASTNLPSKDTIHIEGVNSPNGSTIVHTDDTYHSYATFSGLTFDLQTPNEDAFVRVWLSKDGQRITRFARVRPNTFGYNGIDAGYQRVVIPKTALRRRLIFVLEGGYLIPEDQTEFNEINFEVNGNITTMTLWRIDDINMVTGQNGSDVYNNTYLGLLDTYDLNYNNKVNWSPVVNGAQDGLVLKRTALLEDIYNGNAILRNGAGVEHLGNFDYRVYGYSYLIDSIAYEGVDNFVEGQVTLSDAPLTNPRYDVFVINSDTKAIGSITLTGGTSGSWDALTVNGVSIIDTVVPYTTTLADLAIEIANEINKNVTFPNYFARAINGTIYIEAVEKGVIPNGYVIAGTATGITFSKIDMAGGLDDVHSVGVLTGYSTLNYVKPIPDPLTQVEVTERVTSPAEVAPPEIQQQIIYDENLGDPTEFNIVASSPGSNADYLVNPKVGTKSYYIPNTTGGVYSYIFYSPTHLLDYVEGGTLYFWLWSFTSWPINQIRIGVQIANGPTSSGVVWYNRSAIAGVGFDHNQQSTWQRVAIPISDLPFSATQFNELRIFTDNNPIMQIDEIMYQWGGNAPQVGFTDFSVQDANGIEQFRVSDFMRFEGVTFDQALKKVTVVESPFIAIDEGNGIGWTYKDSDRALSGNIGNFAFDLTYGGTGTEGILGTGSFGFGSSVKATGDGTYAAGSGLDVALPVGIAHGYVLSGGGFASAMFGAHHTDATGNNGYNLIAGYGHFGNGFHNGYIGSNLNADNRRMFGTIFLGVANEDLGQSWTTFTDPEKPYLVLGIGTAATAYPHTLGTKKTGLIVRQNNRFDVPNLSIATIDAAPSARNLITAEWANSKFAPQAVGVGTGNVLTLDKTLGTLYNMGGGDTHSFTSYSINPGTVVGGRASAWINTATKPTVSGADEEGGFPWIANADMYLVVWSPDGTVIKYFFTPKEKLDFVQPQYDWNDNLNKSLLQSDTGYLIMVANTASRTFTIDDVLLTSGSTEFLNTGGSTVTFVAGTANVSFPDGTKLIGGAACTIVKRGNLNEYYLKGELE